MAPKETRPRVRIRLLDSSEWEIHSSSTGNAREPKQIVADVRREIEHELVYARVPTQIAWKAVSFTPAAIAAVFVAREWTDVDEDLS